jgi:hypothetical protein
LKADGYKDAFANKGRKDNRVLLFFRTRLAMSTPNTASAQRQAYNDLMIKGLTCAIIGLVVLVAPFYMQASDLRNIFLQAYIVGWFALVLGLAFVVQGLLRRNKTNKAVAAALAAQKPSYTSERKKNKR